MNFRGFTSSLIAAATMSLAGAQDAPQSAPVSASQSLQLKTNYLTKRALLGIESSGSLVDNLDALFGKISDALSIADPAARRTVLEGIRASYFEENREGETLYGTLFGNSSSEEREMADSLFTTVDTLLVKNDQIQVTPDPIPTPATEAPRTSIVTIAWNMIEDVQAKTDELLHKLQPTDEQRGQLRSLFEKLVASYLDAQKVKREVALREYAELQQILREIEDQNKSVVEDDSTKRQTRSSTISDAHKEKEGTNNSRYLWIGLSAVLALVLSRSRWFFRSRILQTAGISLTRSTRPRYPQKPVGGPLSAEDQAYADNICAPLPTRPPVDHGDVSETLAAATVSFGKNGTAPRLRIRSTVFPENRQNKVTSLIPDKLEAPQIKRPLNGFKVQLPEGRQARSPVTWAAFRAETPDRPEPISDSESWDDSATSSAKIVEAAPEIIDVPPRTSEPNPEPAVDNFGTEVNNGWEEEFTFTSEDAERLQKGLDALLRSGKLGPDVSGLSQEEAAARQREFDREQLARENAPINPGSSDRPIKRWAPRLARKAPPTTT